MFLKQAMVAPILWTTARIVLLQNATVGKLLISACRLIFGIGISFENLVTIIVAICRMNQVLTFVAHLPWTLTLIHEVITILQHVLCDLMNIKSCINAEILNK